FIDERIQQDLLQRLVERHEVGIKNRTFAYAANARKDNQGNLVFGGSAATTIQFGTDVSVHELDMGEGAFLLSAAYAQQLLTSPAPTKVEPAVAKTPATTNGGQPPHGYTPVGEVDKTVVHEPS